MSLPRLNCIHVSLVLAIQIEILYVMKKQINMNGQQFTTNINKTKDDYLLFQIIVHKAKRTRHITCCSLLKYLHIFCLFLAYHLNIL